MKILEGKPLGEKVAGIFECTSCHAKLEVLIKDCTTGRATDYGGNSDDYAGFTCENCGDYQSSHKLPFSEIETYHRVSKQIEKRNQERALKEAQSKISGDNEK